jgi:hypothetical protein
MDLEARAKLHSLGQPLAVAPGVHHDLHSPAGDRLGQRCHVDVLPAGIHSAQSRERAGVL